MGEKTVVILKDERHMSDSLIKFSIHVHKKNKTGGGKSFTYLYFQVWNKWGKRQGLNFDTII